jgi:alanine dehydrogenase
MALTNATLPYIQRLAHGDLDALLRDDPHFANGLNIRAGKITHPAVAAALANTPSEPSAAPLADRAHAMGNAA